MYTTTLRGLAALLAFVVAASSVTRRPGNASTDEKLTQVLAELQEAYAKTEFDPNPSGHTDLGDAKRRRVNSRPTSAGSTKRFAGLSAVRTNISASINPDVAASPSVGTLVLDESLQLPGHFCTSTAIRSASQPPQQARVTEPAGRFNYEVYTDDNTNPVHSFSERVFGGRPGLSDHGQSIKRLGARLTSLEAALRGRFVVCRIGRRP